jgi:plasmid replication initiation protein
MQNDLIVIKSNLVNEFRYSLNREEQKLLLYVISQIREDEEVYKKGFDIYLKDLFKVLELNNTGNKYKYIEQMTDKIMSPAAIRDKDGVMFVNFFSVFHYNHTQGAVNVRMNQDLIAYFIDLKKQFIKYKLNNIMTMKSLYSIRLYEILKQNLYRGKITFNITDLRWKLNVEDKEYKRFKDFRINVLDRAFEEINNNTDIKYTYKEIKIGKSIREIEFEISGNMNKDTEVISMTTGELSIVKPMVETKTVDVFEPQKEKLNLSKEELVEKALLLTIPSHLTNKWIDLKGMDIVNDKLELLTKRKKTQNIASPVGFFISAIQQDWQYETQINNKLTDEQEKEQRKKNPLTVMVEPLSFKTEVEFYEEVSKLEIDFYSPRWIERDMEQAQKNWDRAMNL